MNCKYLGDVPFLFFPPQASVSVAALDKMDKTFGPATTAKLEFMVKSLCSGRFMLIVLLKDAIRRT